MPRLFASRVSEVEPLPHFRPGYSRQSVRNSQRQRPEEFFICSWQARFIWSLVIPEFIACWLAMQSFIDWCVLLEVDEEDEDELLG